MILKVCMQLPGLKVCKVYINDDHGLTVTYFTARSNLVAYVFEWGNLLSHFNGETLAANDKIDRRFEPRHEKTNVMVSDLIRHKPGCTATEDS